MSDLCSCNHPVGRHQPNLFDGFEACADCACPSFSTRHRLPFVKINGKWTIQLLDHRAFRPTWATHEYERLAHMHETIQNFRSNGLRRPLVLDVGAEEGDFAALFRVWGADVFLVEPNMAVWPCLAWHMHLTDLSRHAYVNGKCIGFSGCALTADGTEYAHWTDSYVGMGVPNLSEVIAGHGEWRPGRATQEFDDLDRPNEVTLDKLTAQAGLQPDIITIDVEGMELDVLAGAAETLEAYHPIVYVSVHDGNLLAQIENLMESHDYGVGKLIAIDHEMHYVWSPR